jgi:alpha/beta superfamily hydrolase
VSPLCPGSRLEAQVNERVPAAMVAAAAGPKQLVILPLSDHFFAGQLEPVQAALACWLKEQLR